MTYTLDTSVNTLGYNLTQIDTYSGWDSGRDGQRYTVQYSQVFDPSNFSTIGSFNNNFNLLSSGAGNQHGNRRVRMTDSDGFLALNVASIRFNFQDAENGWTAFREIDVLGSPIQAVPEPSSLCLMLCIAVFVTCARNKQRNKQRNTANRSGLSGRIWFAVTLQLRKLMQYFFGESKKRSC